jgi:hypothetical protein
VAVCWLLPATTAAALATPPPRSFDQPGAALQAAQRQLRASHCTSTHGSSQGVLGACTGRAQRCSGQGGRAHSGQRYMSAAEGCRGWNRLLAAALTSSPRTQPGSSELPRRGADSEARLRCHGFPLPGGRPSPLFSVQCFSGQCARACTRLVAGRGSIALLSNLSPLLGPGMCRRSAGAHPDRLMAPGKPPPTQPPNVRLNPPLRHACLCVAVHCCLNLFSTCLLPSCFP